MPKKPQPLIPVQFLLAERDLLIKRLRRRNFRLRKYLSNFRAFYAANTPTGCQTCGSPCVVCGRQRVEPETFFHVFRGECFCNECFEKMQTSEGKEEVVS
jgi:hypothetical protein